MKKYKVLHILNGADLGGIPSVVLNYYRNIDRSFFKFDFVVPPGVIGPNGAELEKLGGTFHILPLKSKHLFAFMKELRKLIKQNNYDVVHAHHHDTSYVSLFVALFCGVKCRVAQSHTFLVGGESIGLKFRRYVAVLLNDLSSNLRFACNEEAANYLFGKRLKRLFPVTILPNGVEPENFIFSEEARSLTRKEFGLDSETLVFGVVARMSAEKNHRFLIDVLQEILKYKKNVKLLFVGDGPLRGDLCDYAKQIKLSSDVIFAGQRKELVPMLSAMDVFTLPSFYEGSPVSAVEAAANGLPLVLSSPITKGLSFFKNVAYIDIDANSREKWAKTVIDFSTKGRDENAISTINKNGYNVKDIASLLIASYCKTIEK